MDTRKLITACAFSLFGVTGFTQSGVPIAGTSASTSSITGQPGLRTSNPESDDIETYKNKDGNNVIKWSTANQVAVEFLVQGSTDGINFRVVKRIAVTAVATGKNIYEATDESRKGYTYFRVIHVSNAGNYYSKAIRSKP